MSAERFAQLERLGTRTITTAQASAAWRVSTSAASKTLADLASAGLVVRLRHGVWLLDRTATAESLAVEIAAPYPAYVSHVSALYTRGIIDQVPAEVHVVAAAAEPRRIETSRGAFRIHRIQPVLFGGFTMEEGVPLATVEKALFDWAYLSVAAGRPDARLPETEWPPTLRRGEIRRWLKRIGTPRIRTLAGAAIDRGLAMA